MNPILNAADRRLADERHLHLPLRRVPALAGDGLYRRDPHIDNPGPAEVVQHGCIQGADAVHSSY